MSPHRIKEIPRKHVLNTLAEAVKSHSLVILKSPMGYGKTAAARELGEHLKREGYLICFETTPSNADDLRTLFCNPYQESGFAGSVRCKEDGESDACRNMSDFLATFRENLGGRPVLFILDDYQSAQSPEVNGLIEIMARESIPGFCILLLSRDRPILPIEDLLLRNHAAIFGRDLLALSELETETLYAVNGSDDKEAASAAWELSEGWLAAVLMCLRSFLSGGAAIPNHDIQRFLMLSFFEVYEEAEQRLLLELSVLPSFSLDEAVFISNNPSASHLLRALFDKNVLLNYQPGTDSYRMLGLFRSFLERLLEENTLDVCKSIDKQELYHRAGLCMSNGGKKIEAAFLMHKAGRVQDMERILEGFESPGKGICLAREPEAIAAIVENIPWEIRREHPIGYLSYIFHYMIRVDRDYAVELLAEAEEYFDSQESMPLDLKNRIKGEISLIRAFQQFNDITAMYDHIEKAFGLLQGRSKLLHKELSWTLDCPHLAFLYVKNPAMYKGFVQLLNKRWTYYHAVSGGSSGSPELICAEYLLEKGDYLSAHSPLAKAVAAAKASGELNMGIAVAFTKARLHLAHGQMDAARKTFESVAPAVKKSRHPLRDFMLGLSQGYIASTLGQCDKIPGWLFSDEAPGALNFCGRSMFTYIVRGKVLLAQHDWHRLEVLAEKIVKPLEEMGIALGRIHFFIFKAIVASHTGSMSQALEYYSKAVDIARSGNIITSIAEYGSHLHALHRSLHASAPDDKFIIILGKNIKRYARLLHNKALRLTLREQDIIERVARGESNRAIGQHLGISPGTVANNLGRIYNKLGVKNRIEAIKIWSSYLENTVDPPLT